MSPAHKLEKDASLVEWLRTMAHGWQTEGGWHFAPLCPPSQALLCRAKTVQPYVTALNKNKEQAATLSSVSRVVLLFKKNFKGKWSSSKWVFTCGFGQERPIPVTHRWHGQRSVRSCQSISWKKVKSSKGQNLKHLLPFEKNCRMLKQEKFLEMILCTP